MKKQWAVSIVFIISTVLLLPHNVQSRPGNVDVDVKVHVNGKKVIDESHPKRPDNPVNPVHPVEKRTGRRINPIIFT